MAEYAEAESPADNHMEADPNLFEDDTFEETFERPKKPKRLNKLKKHDSYKRKRLNVSAFLDTEAQVGEEDDENYEDDSLLPDESTEAERLENRSRLRRLQEDQSQRREGRRVGGTGYLETAIDKLAKRYQDQTFEEDEDGYISETPERVQYDEIEETTALMPDFGDPKLWIIKTTRRGSDRVLAISLLNKFLKMQSEGRNMGIYSCFVPDGVSGYIYVEADTKAVVLEALAEFRQINLNTIKIVPMNEMLNVFTTGTDSVYIPMVDEYVRVKFGRYGGDLGQVFESDELSSAITIKLIPRLDPEVYNLRSLDGDRLDADNINDFDAYKVGKDTKLRKNRKPPRKFFDRESVELNGGFIEQGITPGTYKYQGFTFLESGHILIRMNVKRVITGDSVNATLTELKEFNIDKIDGNISETVGMGISRAPKKLLHYYKLGECVRVIKGELVSIIGKIISIDNEEVEIQPKNDEVPAFKIHYTSIIKHFEEGDNVRAIGGMNEGETGLISMINEANKIAVIFSPQSGQEFKCGLEYLTCIPKEGASSNALGAFNGYSINDLVQTSTGTVGIVIGIDRSGMFSILTEDGTKIKCTASQVICKRSSFGNTCKDFNHQPIELKSRVMVVRGAYRHKSGQVLHLWKNTVFLFLESGETISVHSESCLATTHSAPIYNNREKIAGKKGAVFRKSPLVGKTVKILQGRHKGLFGDITNVEPTQFTILLKIKAKVVRYPKGDCVVVDNWHTTMREQSRSFSSLKPSITKRSADTFKNQITTSETPQTADLLHGNNELPAWALRGVCIQVIGSGTYQGKIGVVGEVVPKMADTSLHVLHVLIDDDYIAIATESVVPVRPKAPGETVLVLMRSEDKIATVIRVDDQIATVQTLSGHILDLQTNDLVVYSEYS
ncbi:conserved hypothetical protein [Theileria equi strain WA]|uniref:KOW domain-containing protein n=1 Tax=Theileria equi strain WA TaxID=1537102 RepID=L1LCV3_THEEQ|nr:conserved hypothetical protein [Theileria equi strain WA]EKX73114.1 conserved hypothetical protein [Theileria equi strain WA]|eukprot:XP_004832566.1 conserved hypothetical protein [Theileria equi strain WA]